MGELVATNVDLEIEVSDTFEGDRGVPGLGWSLSDNTIKTMREIDANIRAAEQMSGSLLVG